MRDYVMTYTTAIVDGLLVRATIERDPWMVRLLVNVKLRLGHHLIKDLLEGTVSSWRWLETDVIGGISPSPGFLRFHLGSI
jgi:hypothetical protein